MQWVEQRKYINQQEKDTKKILKAEREEQVYSTSLETEEKGTYMLSGQRHLGSLLPNRSVGSSISIWPPQNREKTWGL